MWVSSCSTGTKCTAQRHNECVLHDSHAEVLARRGLMRVILAEITANENGDVTDNGTAKNTTGSRALLVERKDFHDESNNRSYQMNPDIGLHFYISDSPCGDASIYSVPTDDTANNNNNNNNNNGILYTGAKVIVSKATKVDATDCGGKHQLLPSTENSSDDKGKTKEADTDDNSKTAKSIFAREEIQVLGKLRIKSGRSNLPAHMRSHSHSCSDKLASWSVLGLQGGLLTRFLDPPIIPLASVVVSGDSRLHTANDENDVGNQHEEQHRPQRIALERAIPGRAQSVWNHLGAPQQDRFPSWKPPIPTVHIVPQTFVSGKAAMTVPSMSSSLAGEKRKQSGDRGESQGIDSNNQDTGHAIKNSNGSQTQKAVPPCGMCFNWNQNEDIEVLVGARGIKQGKKPKTPRDIEKLASRLSRARFLRDCTFLGTNDSLSTCIAIENERPSRKESANPLMFQNSANGYHQIKQDGASREWALLKTRILTEDGSPLAGWLRCVPTNDEPPLGKNEEMNR